jgi:type I restriction enzyme S subunit
VSGWREKTLREAGVSLIDCDHRTPPAADSGYPYIAIPQIKQGRLDLGNVRRITREHFLEWTRKAKPQPNDVVLSRRCNPGETAVVPADLECALGQNLVLLRADSAKMFPPFLRWLVRGGDWWKQIGKFLNVGAVFDSLKCADIPNFRLPFPPLPEQKLIASVLGALDDKIELNRRMNETLEAMARALFQNRFVDATQAGLPKGWREGTVDEEFILTMGQSPPGESYNETGDGTPFYQGRTDFGFRYPTARVFCTAPTRFANAGDTLVSVRAPVGSVNMAAQKCSVGRGVAGVRHKSGSRSYTYYFMRSLEPDFARFEADGTVFGSINKADFHAIKRAAPPSEVVEAFEKLLFPIDQRIENNENESRTLAALRDALLPKLLSGELRLPVKTD